MRIPVLLAGICCAALVATQRTCGQADVTLQVRNLSQLPRSGILQASVPFARGAVFQLSGWSVAGRRTAWRTLQSWPDGSVRVAQAQFEDTLAPREQSTRRVTATPQGFGSPFALHPWVASRLARFAIVTQVRDVDGVSYFAVPSSWELVSATEAVVTVRSRALHVALPGTGGIGRDFLSQTLYLTFFRTTPVVWLDYVLGNDYLGADRPAGNDPNLRALGDVAVQEAWLHVFGAWALMRYERENNVTPVVVSPELAMFRLLSNDYIGDGQTKRWRAVLCFDDPTAPLPQRQTALATLIAEKETPVIPLAAHAAWQGTGAFGVNGGPVAPPPDWSTRVTADWNSWTNNGGFGPWGSWGDTKQTFVGGTPRNGPASEPGVKAVQTGSIYPAIQLEGMAWQQACRPLHMYRLRVNPNSDIYLETGLPFTITGGRRVDSTQELLGREALFRNDPYAHYRLNVPLSRNHDWNGYDPEHWSTDLLFDYYALTGDPWAKDELRHLGECIMGMLRETKYFSALVILAARAEGWAMQGFVQCYLATGDIRLRDAAVRRAHNLIDRLRQRNHPSKALVFQDTHSATLFPPTHRYFMPWQHGAVVFGYTAAGEFFNDPLFTVIARDVVATVAYSWVLNYQDPRYGYVPQGLRYYTPVQYNGQPVLPDVWDYTPGIGVRWGDSPLGGAHEFLIGAMDLVREHTSDPTTRTLAFLIRESLHVGMRRTEAWRWFKWSALREPPTTP